ncbi:MAG: hypothetical protein PVI30_10035 [Myxococcales bacterium]|jgi:hypothetical protein
MVRTPIPLLLAFLIPVGGCIDEKCDPGYERIRGSCFIEATGADGGAAQDDDDAGAPAEGGRDMGCDPGDDVGEDCSGDADCGCGTVCAPVLNYCTLTNCHETGAPDCPDGSECLDISDQTPDPSITSICFVSG